MKGRGNYEKEFKTNRPTGTVEAERGVKMIYKRKLMNWLKAMIDNGRFTKDMNSILEVLYALIETGTFDEPIPRDVFFKPDTYTVGHNENETAVIVDDDMS